MLSYYEVLGIIYRDKRHGIEGAVVGSELLATMTLGLVKLKYNWVEKLIGHIRWRIRQCVRYVQRITKK